MSCLDKQLHALWTIFQPHMTSSFALASSFDAPGCIVKRSPSLAIGRLDPHSKFDQIRRDFVIAQVAGLGERGSCQLALNLRICAFGVEIVHDVEFALEGCEVDWSSVLELSVVEVHLCLLYEEFDDLEVEALDCVEDGCLLLLVQELEVASELQQKSQSGNIRMDGSKVSQVKPILNALIDSLRIRLANALDCFQVIALDSREELRVRQLLILDSLDDSVELGAEYQGIELVFKVLLELVVEVRVKLYEKGHQFLGGFEHSRPNGAFRQA